MESSRSTSPCSRRETMSSSSDNADSKLSCSMAGGASLFSAMYCSRTGGDQRADMCSCGTRRSIKVIASLKGRDNAAGTGLGGDGAYLSGRPGEIVLVETQLGERVGAVCIEPCRNDQEIRPERGQRRQHA